MDSRSGSGKDSKKKNNAKGYKEVVENQDHPCSEGTKHIEEVSLNLSHYKIYESLAPEQDT